MKIFQELLNYRVVKVVVKLSLPFCINLELCSLSGPMNRGCFAHSMVMGSKEKAHAVLVLGYCGYICESENLVGSAKP